MEPNQVNPSPENQGIPQGIPTGVFVPNNQVPVQAPVVATPTPQVSAAQTLTPQVGEGPLDKVFKGLAKFFAKVMGQPDPITGAPNAASQALQTGENIVGKVRGAANQAVSKATDVATQAAQQVQQIIPPPTVAPQTSSLIETPVAPVVAPTEPVQMAGTPVQEPVQPTI